MRCTLKAARVNAGLTQTDLARALGVAKTSIINWENGLSPMRRVSKLAICYVLGLREEDILETYEEAGRYQFEKKGV